VFAIQKVYLIYNTYKDKDYKSILKILKPIIKKLLIIDIDNNRVENRENLENTLNNLAINFDTFRSIEKDKNYLVFGSFSVVEEFLKRYKQNER
jgi:dihydrofolate synthase/folylpolyglutamate synthase